MELRHIRYFLVVSEEKNFTKAAMRLAMAQPPLSRQIKDLEEELGCELFIRNTRGLMLTPEGEKFKQYAQQIVNLADRSAEDIRDMKKGLQGMLYLATVEGKAPALLSEWISAFKKEYPLVQYSIWNGDSDDVSSRVFNGLCDMAIITAPYDQEHLQGIEVYKEPWVAMIPVKHPLAEKKADCINIEELVPYELLIPSRQSRLQEIMKWFENAPGEPQIICRLAHMVDAYELTKNGVGIAIYPQSAADYSSKDKVCIKRIINPSVDATYVFARAAAINSSLIAQEFWDFVVSKMAEKNNSNAK